MVEILESRQGGLASTLDGNFPELRATVWQSEASVQAAVQTLTPQMTENRKKVTTLPLAVFLRRRGPTSLLLQGVLQAACCDST